MRIAFFGPHGKVGAVLVPALVAEGHDVIGVDRGEKLDLEGIDATVDFTAPEAVAENVRASLAAGAPSVVGTSGADLTEVGAEAEERGLQVFFAPNFALGAVLMMRFAEEASRHLLGAEIIELHHETKRDAPSGTAIATAGRLRGEAPIHSVRLPGLVAHQEVLFGAPGQLLTIRHDAYTREAYVPGVLLALERVHQLPPGLTVGLEALLS
jgi:4-hydroxy-tetrahydrodipicolinate reductase